ncbi:unnamed protein product [Strongylus vulgaris]|uniref:Secreted protein n=1 Tax=Strongylus vulgaris TaxID=40348 RepID=A0A3P7ISX3_STRVU|nr:unnamed protein product [Strongylus vulgaris]
MLKLIALGTALLVVVTPIRFENPEQLLSDEFSSGEESSGEVDQFGSTGLPTDGEEGSGEEEQTTTPKAPVKITLTERILTFFKVLVYKLVRFHEVTVR